MYVPSFNANIVETGLGMLGRESMTCFVEGEDSARSVSQEMQSKIVVGRSDKMGANEFIQDKAKAQSGVIHGWSSRRRY